MSLFVMAAAGRAGEPVEVGSSLLLKREKDGQGPAGQAELEGGFRKDSKSVEVKLSRAFGTTDAGSVVSHDLWLTQLQTGWMLTDVMEPKYWFGGNLEGLGQLLAGGQDQPDDAYLVGLNAGLRYHFRTGTRVHPFVAGFVGLALTDIGAPDLSGTLQFNESIGAGARFLITRNYAVTAEYALWHVSNGGRRDPNSGLTSHVVSLGFGWLF